MFKKKKEPSPEEIYLFLEKNKDWWMAEKEEFKSLFEKENFILYNITFDGLMNSTKKYCLAIVADDSKKEILTRKIVLNFEASRHISKFKKVFQVIFYTKKMEYEIFFYVSRGSLFFIACDYAEI